MDRLERMALSENPFDRQVAAQHPKLPVKYLAMLLVDENVGVRRAAVKSPNITENLLLMAMHDNDQGIVAYARLLQFEE